MEEDASNRCKPGVTRECLGHSNTSELRRHELFDWLAKQSWGGQLHVRFTLPLFKMDVETPPFCWSSELIGAMRLTSNIIILYPTLKNQTEKHNIIAMASSLIAMASNLWNMLESLLCFDHVDSHLESTTPTCGIAHVPRHAEEEADGRLVPAPYRKGRGWEFGSFARQMWRTLMCWEDNFFPRMWRVKNSKLLRNHRWQITLTGWVFNYHHDHYVL